MPTLQRTSQLPTFPLTVRRQMVGFRQRLAERIVDAREAKGWDQRELAFRAKVSEKTVQRLEQAKVNSPRGSTLRKIAEATSRQVEDIRPDMETEERNLRAQLDRIEKRQEEMDRKLDELLTRTERRLPAERDPEIGEDPAAPPDDADLDVEDERPSDEETG